VVLYSPEFWNPMLTWVRDHVLADGYIKEADLQMLRVTDDPDEVVERMLSPVAHPAPKDPN